jgi:hypothetical protein
MVALKVTRSPSTDGFRMDVSVFVVGTGFAVTLTVPLVDR